MNRLLTVMVTCGVLVLPSPALHSLGATSPPGLQGPTPPEATPDSRSCTLPNGSVVAQKGGCCEAQGGICGCREE